ncbi:hypothetical protein Cpir12675_006966 [Ceratocystis pirilliformis]|uniref:Retrotransposon Copia-like N-terminal domain-containing protein n=1 Tax=Ceratocystis pirilliformis TaxID=259994 RepID=A0ABR3YDX1_9PEZI
MSSNQNTQAGSKYEEDLGTLLKSLVQTVLANKTPESPSNSNSSSKDVMLMNFPKLNEINWEKWSRGTIRNLKARKVTYLFKGLEEEEFVNAMELERSDDDRARDEADAFGIIRAGHPRG